MPRSLQVRPGQFVRHELERGQCDHATCVAGDWDGDGRVHFATGNFIYTKKRPVPEAIHLWKNETSRATKRE